MQEIPKLFTVAAECSTCVVFAVVLKNRFSRGKTAGILAGFLLAFCMLQTGIGIWSVELWIPAMAQMYLCIFVSCEIW